jgi:hypothetical protein
MPGSAPFSLAVRTRRPALLENEPAAPSGPAFQKSAPWTMFARTRRVLEVEQRLLQDVDVGLGLKDRAAHRPYSLDHRDEDRMHHMHPGLFLDRVLVLVKAELALRVHQVRPKQSRQQRLDLPVVAVRSRIAGIDPQVLLEAGHPRCAAGMSLESNRAPRSRAMVLRWS